MLKEKFILILLSVFLVIVFSSNTTKAVEFKMNWKTGEVVSDEVTAKEKAPNAIWWSTVGLTLKNKECPDGNPIAEKPYARFSINNTDHKEEFTDDKGIVHTKFKFPYEFIDKNMDTAGVTAKTLQASGNKIFLNGIFRVYKPNSTIKKSGDWCTLQGIINAESSWGSTEGFKERFNMWYKYPEDLTPAKQPVYLTIMRYSSKNGYVTDSSKLIGYYTKRTFYSTKTADIEASYKSPVSGSELWLFQTHWAKRSDSQTVHSNGTYRTMRDKLKTSINPLDKTQWEDYKLSLQALRNRQYEVLEGGIEIVCVYKGQSPPDKPDIPDTPGGITGTNDFSRDIVTPYTSCVIQSNTRGAEIYDSSQAIPSSDYQYVNVATSEYLAQYTFRQYYGVKYYKQKVGETLVDVPRTYAYWKIIDLNVYALASSYVENGSLPAGGLTLTPATGYYSAPYISYNVYSSNMIEPASGGTSVGQILVRNDALYFNDTSIMSGAWCSSVSIAPDVLPAAERISENALYRTGLLIDAQKKNGEYDTQATVKYVRICQYGDDSEGPVIEFDVENTNNVTVHTPTICDALVQDTKQYNQMIEPAASTAGLVLDTYFNVKLPTEGTHDINLKGYQTRDYAKYIARREVKFPFDVYRNGTYIKAGTWSTLTQEITSIYLPTWVKEDFYTIEFRCCTINCDTNNGLEQTEELANLDYNNYVATDTVDVQVSGRLFDFNVYDISDYPNWQKVFRQPDSLKFTNFNYTTGTKDRNGNQSYMFSGEEREEKYTLPLVDGSHPKFNFGYIKTGYYNRFSMRTMGTFDGVDDYIHIRPRFYFVNGNGSGRQEVDLYYTEYFESDNKKHILVKVGSELDKKNTHRADRDDPYLGVRGGSTIIKEPWAYWTFGDIKITGSLMLRSGNYNFTPQVKTTDPELLEKQSKSVQTWFCEYYLPAKIYVAPKGFNVDQYALDHNGLDFSESFWKKNGFIIINFDIEAIKDGEPYLSYINKENALNGGYCNMWKMEGGILTKTDSYGFKFDFKYGDYALYYVDPKKSVTNDYQSGGVY